MAERNLRDFETFIKSILNTTPCHIYIYDLEKNQNIYSAPHSEVMLGYTPEEMRNMGDSALPNLIHPDDEIILNQTIQKIMDAKDNEIVEGEYRFRHKNGKYLHIFDRVMVFKRTVDGQVSQILGSAINITEYKKKEKEIFDLAQFPSENPYPVLRVNRNGVMYINEAGQKLLNIVNYN